MSTATLDQASTVAKIDLFATRFQVEGTPVTPSGSYDIRSDDTGTWVKDTEDNDT